jgi:uncharacterized protein (DUF362 family)
LKITGIDKVLKFFNTKYINITNEYWKNNCVDETIIQNELSLNDKKIYWKPFLSYVPKDLFKIRNSATLISLAKIKIEKSIKDIMVSLSIKNLFGLIPHPSRKNPFHDNNHSNIPKYIVDIFTIYKTLFNNSLWINEGIKTLIENYCESNQKIIKDKNIIFISKDPIQADSNVCCEFDIDTNQVPYFCSID